MRRCGQLNFNERDPLTLDVEAWATYWSSLKVDALLLNGGGIVAFYPTEVPYHRRSEFLGARDLFGEMTAAARKRAIRVVARMDCNYAYEEALQAHPEWFERDREGGPRRHGESTWLYKTCMFSPYFTEHMPAIYREVNRRYAPDGFFTNGWPSTGALGVCHCESCRKVYDRLGGVPSEETDAGSPVYRRYYEAYMDRIAEVWRLWDQVAREGGGLGVRRPPRRRHPRCQGPRAAGGGGGVVQRGPPGPGRGYPDLGLRPAGPGRAVGHEGPGHHQRHRRLQQQPAGVASRGQAGGGEHAVDGPDHGERDGPVVPLARGRPRGPALARRRPCLLRLAGRARTAFPEPPLRRRPGRPLPPEHDRLLPLGLRPGELARRGAGADERVPAGALLRARRRPVSFRLRPREGPHPADPRALPRPPHPERGPPERRVLPANPGLRRGRRLPARHLRDVALRRMGRPAGRPRPDRRPRRERRR